MSFFELIHRTQNLKSKSLGKVLSKLGGGIYTSGASIIIAIVVADYGQISPNPR